MRDLDRIQKMLRERGYREWKYWKQVPAMLPDNRSVNIQHSQAQAEKVRKLFFKDCMTGEAAGGKWRILFYEYFGSGTFDMRQIDGDQYSTANVSIAVVVDDNDVKAVYVKTVVHELPPERG